LIRVSFEHNDNDSVGFESLLDDSLLIVKLAITLRLNVFSIAYVFMCIEIS